MERESPLFHSSTEPAATALCSDTLQILDSRPRLKLYSFFPLFASAVPPSTAQPPFPKTQTTEKGVGGG